MNDRLTTDLRERWRPTHKQIALADTVADTMGRNGHGEKVAYTLHLLVNKTYAFWTEDVTLVHLDGVFTDRATALTALVALAAEYHERTGKKVTGGFTRHYGDGEWTVFEDILARYPKEA